MKPLHFAALAALTLAAAAPLPAVAQEWPVVSGDYVDVSTIKVDDGHALDYANHLAGKWRESQEFAKSKGWITDYQVWNNEFPRDGEANIFLITWFPTLPSAAESDMRDKMYREHMKTTAAALQAESGERATYRHLADSMLMRVQNWKK